MNTPTHVTLAQVQAAITALGFTALGHDLHSLSIVPGAVTLTGYAKDSHERIIIGDGNSAPTNAACRWTVTVPLVQKAEGSWTETGSCPEHTITGPDGEQIPDPVLGCRACHEPQQDGPAGAPVAKGTHAFIGHFRFLAAPAAPEDGNRG